MPREAGGKRKRLRRRVEGFSIYRLEEIKLLIEKLRIMHDDPERPKVRAVGLAPVPLEAD